MNTKRLLLSFLAILLVASFLAINAYATTWYVRDGGGDPSQCTGTTNAVYPGTGTNLPCAINHPAWVIGTPGANALMVGGDTLYIVGDSDLNPGGQAQYMIGYGMPNTVGAQCSTSSAYSCILSPVPAGTSPSARTTIIGIGTHQPQLWGTQGLWNVLYLTLGNYDVENLEITDHDSCTNQGMDPKGTVDGFPAYCGGTDGAFPYGPWASSGLQLKGSNIITKNLHVHRFASEDITFPGNLSNWNSTNDVFTSSGGGGALTNGGNMSFGGNNTMDNDTWAFGGCSEHYPTPDPGNVLDPANYHHCCDQSCGGYSLGGGFMMQNDGAGACGNWTINNSQFLFNLKTNIDFLHCDGTGNFNLYRSRSEGSSGEAFKAAVANVNLEEDQLIGNAPVWNTSVFKGITSPYDISGNPVNSLMVCRGDAVTIFNLKPGSQINYINDDVTGNCTALVETNEYGTCAGAAINAYNTKFIGGYAYDVTGQQVDLYYNGGNDGNGDGPCGSSVPFNETNDSVYGINNYGLVTNTSGTNTISSDPLIVGEETVTLENLLGPSIYYGGTHLGDLLYLQSSSPLRRGAAVNAPFTNGSLNDYNDFPGNVPLDIGAVQYGTCVLSGGYCGVAGQCCNSGTCSLNGQCAAPQPVVAITSPSNGSSFTAGSNVPVSATAGETNGAISKISLYNGTGALLGSNGNSPFTFVDTNVATGTHTYMAAAKDAYGVSVNSKPVTVTVTAAPVLSSLPVVTVSSLNGTALTVGSNIAITASASETNGSISNISLYNGAGALIGSSSTSPYHYINVNAAAGTYTFTAKATDANGVSATSNPITITVVPHQALPVVALTSPANASSFTAGSYITISATASETNGTITKVAFYNGSTLLGTATSSPYTFTWNMVPAGNYSLTAVAYDNNNQTAASAPVAVAVSGLPVINLVSNNASFTAPASIIFTATSSEVNGTITKVAFYNGSTLLGSTTGSPCKLMWINAPPGNYNVTAVAYDNNNNQTISAPVAVTVNGLPVVSLASNNTSFTTPASVILTATASEAGGTISKVDFYNGPTLIGTATSPVGGTGNQYRLMWISVPPGNYTLTAKATDSQGATATSTNLSISVNSPPSGPTVSITSPVNNASYTVPASILLIANASEAGGTITRVDFYNGSISLGTALNPPYRLFLINTPAGTYNLTAKATDSNGASATSSPVSILVKP